MSDISLRRSLDTQSLDTQSLDTPGRAFAALVRRLDPARTTGIIVVLLLHLFLIHALITTLAHRTVPLVPSAIQIRLLPQPKQDEQRLLPPPPPKFLAPPPPAYVPPPEIVIQAPPAASVSTAIQANSEKPAVIAPASPPVPAKQVRIEPDLDSAHSEEPEYPPMSRRLVEEGLVTLLVLVGPDGAVQEVRLEKSSGHQRLDEAAMVAAREHSRFTPGSLDGKAAAMWYRYRYDFHLN